MQSSKPIYEIAKDLCIDTNKIIIACKSLGIQAKGSSKKLNSEQLEKIIKYFNTGQNASIETIDIGNKNSEKVKKKKSIRKETNFLKNTYFPNRLIG